MELLRPSEIQAPDSASTVVDFWSQFSLWTAHLSDLCSPACALTSHISVIILSYVNTRASFKCTTLWRKRCTGLTWQMTITPSSVIAAHVRRTVHMERSNGSLVFSWKGPLSTSVWTYVNPLSKTEEGKQFFIIMTDSYTKLTKAISTEKSNVT